VFFLHDGKYECKSCVPPYTIAADGKDQPVGGHPYYDTRAVKVVDDHTIQETAKKDGKVVTTSTMTVAADGKTATFELSDSSASNAAPVTAKGTMARVAKGPAGSHAVSGSWRTTHYENASDNGLTFTFKVTGDNVNYSTPTGQAYEAKLDGTEAPYKGDPGTTSVSVKKIGKNTLQETDKLNGKTISIATLTVAADGRSMKIAVKDIPHGRTSSFTAKKQ
jgi:hypothetical protein